MRTGAPPRTFRPSHYRRSPPWRAYAGDFLPQLTYLREEEPSIYVAVEIVNNTVYKNGQVVVSLDRRCLGA